MCMQCMAGVATAGAAATGLRAWLATRGWLSARLLKRVTIGLIAAALIASAFVVSGSSQPASAQAGGSPGAASSDR